MEIKIDDLSGPEIAKLLEAHLDLMRSLSPPESVHALDLDALRTPDITFWTAWENEELLGCVALRDMGEGEGEIKSMHTAKASRGKGIAQQMLDHLESHALKAGMKRLSLETGRPEAFAPARKLYEKNGYRPCPPFGNYTDDPFSICMTKVL